MNYRSPPRTPNQIALITAMVKELEGQGFKDINVRQYNKIIEAADLIVGELTIPDTPSVPKSGLASWLASDSTGVSSRAMASVLGRAAGMEPAVHSPPCPHGDHPRDPSDFGRCIGLLEAVPELRAHLDCMASHSPVWAALVAHWSELESLYIEERPRGVAPKLYRRMRGLIEANEKGSNE